MAPTTPSESRTVNAADAISIRAVEAARARLRGRRRPTVVVPSGGTIDTGPHLRLLQGADGPEASAP